MLEITAGSSRSAHASRRRRPKTVAAFRRMLPLDSKIIHVRWSGEGGWIPMGGLDVGLGPENATSYPSPGELIFYPGGVSETELLLAYGYVAFASKAGALAGNHFATIVEGREPARARGAACSGRAPRRSRSRKVASCARIADAPRPPARRPLPTTAHRAND